MNILEQFLWALVHLVLDFSVSSAFFWGGAFSSPPSYLSPSVFRTWRIFCLWGHFSGVAFCWFRRPCSIHLLWGFLRADFCKVADLLTIPAVRPPALYHHHHHHHHHLSIFMIDTIRDGLKAFPVKAKPGHIVSMCHLSGGSQLHYVLDVTVNTEKRSHNLSCNSCWDITDSYTDPTRS